MQITDCFDGGNIVCRTADDPAKIELEIRKDNASDFYQWFYFRLSGARGVDCVMRLMNAAGAAYAGGWEGYRAVASYDRQNWFRVTTTYRDGVLIIRHRPEADAVWYAYFAPYSMERHADLVARCQSDNRVSLTVLGRTLDGQDMDLLTIGAPGKDKKRIWVIARQHPGETMAEWAVEGMLDRLLDRADPLAGALLDEAVFYVVPNMNPDGSRRGNLRTNAAGANLNREWQSPTMEQSPEVFLVRQAMETLGLDLCLDVHGDETLPCNYIIGSEGIPSWSPEQASALDTYKAALATACPTFKLKKRCPRHHPARPTSISAPAILPKSFGALAMTLEQPFKDNTNRPDETHGWSPARARHLGRANLDAIRAVLPILPAPRR